MTGPAPFYPTCSEEAGYSWFWTTPEGYKFPANTRQNYFWASGYPKDVSSELNFAPFVGANFGYEDSSTSYGYSVICEYLEPYPTYSNFDHACLLSKNPSATGYSSCFTLNRNATTFAVAQSQCTEFTGGHLARLNTIAMATYLSSELWAMTGLPPSMPLFTGLQQFPLSPSDEPNKQWYWMYPDGTKSLANSSSLPWNATQPQSTGECASMNQNGLLFVTNCSALQWSICQYLNPMIKSYTGTANVMGSSATAITETNNYSMDTCERSCRNNGDCTSFAYSYTTSVCQLIGGGSSSTVPASGFIWFNILQ